MVFALEDLFQILTNFGLYLQTYFTSLSADFLNHKKRIFIGYLAISIVMALVFLWAWRGLGMRCAFNKVFDKKIFWSASAKADYVIYAINRLISIAISPYLIAQGVVTTFLFFQLSKQNVIGFLSLDHWPVIQRQKTNNILLTQLEKQESGNYPLSNKVRRDRYRN